MKTDYIYDQHCRCADIIHMIRRCDRKLEANNNRQKQSRWRGSSETIEQLDTERNKYKAIRERLYEYYADVLIRICKEPIEKIVSNVRVVNEQNFIHNDSPFYGALESTY